MTIQISNEVLITKKELEDLLPHRDRALKIDKVIFDNFNPKKITAIKIVRPDDPDFEGHFPGDPYYPGICLIECANLAAAILVIKTNPGIKGLPQTRGYSYIGFKNPVKPGDVLTIEVELIKIIRNNLIFLLNAKIKNQKGKIVVIINDIKGVVV